MSAPRSPLGPVDPSAAAPARHRKTARRFERTSDLWRVGDALAAALVAVVVFAAIAAMGPGGGHFASPGPLARPHVVANVGCASCHASAVPAVDSCAGCHGSHGSTRPGHRAAMASGALRCVDCHPAHGGAAGVTFQDGGRFVRWGEPLDREPETGITGPAGASVPFVATRACARCHDLSQAGDPAARCLPPAGPAAQGWSRCFDEHQRPGTAIAVGAAACARQHTASRFVAWEAASQVLVRPRGPSGSPAAPWPFGAVLGAFGVGAFAFVAFAGVRRRRARGPAGEAPSPAAPRALLPRIDASTCLGCYACVDACPFDVLAIERYVAVVARPNDCCGVILCAQACPNSSLTIAEGPALSHALRLDAHGESLDASGVFVAGDLSGVPLIKNAIHQGRRVIDRIAETLPRAARGRDGAVDVAIVGAGPAGLSAALRAQELGLSYVCLEQGTMAQSVRSFPRGKLVFDQPLTLPLEGDLWLRECTKEELLAQWARIVRRRSLRIEEHHRVTDVSRSSGELVLSAAGTTRRAQRLVLAIGKRGTPRPLDCAIDDAALSSVAYSLADARSFEGQRVVVVGLGDSAMEAAVALQRQPSTTVIVSYRGTTFARGKARNVAELKALADRAGLRIAWGTRVAHVRQGAVVLETVDGLSRETVACDAVLAFLGGTPAWELLRMAGVQSSLSVSPGPPGEAEPPNPVGP